MTIETKFDRGESAWFVYEDKVVRFPVKKIEYFNGYIHYTFVTRKGSSLGDKDTEVVRNEEDCFKTIEDLAAYFAYFDANKKQFQ